MSLTVSLFLPLLFKWKQTWNVWNERIVTLPMQRGGGCSFLVVHSMLQDQNKSSRKSIFWNTKKKVSVSLLMKRLPCFYGSLVCGEVELSRWLHLSLVGLIQSVLAIDVIHAPFHKWILLVPAALSQTALYITYFHQNAFVPLQHVTEPSSLPTACREMAQTLAIPAATLMQWLNMWMSAREGGDAVLNLGLGPATALSCSADNPIIIPPLFGRGI